MNTVEIIFSPTGGTEKVAHIISRQWSESTTKIDLSDFKTDFSGCAIGKEDRVLIAMPSFGGRAPAVAIERLKKIAGNGAKCTLVCVYGNRAYEDTLAEMEDAAKACGFHVVAAVAAVAQHSIIPQYAANRPDASDEKQLAEFLIAIGMKPTLTGEVMPIPIQTSSLIGGLSKPSYQYIDAIGARKPLIMNNKSMGRAGYFGKKVSEISRTVKMSKTTLDCNTKHLIKYEIKVNLV